MVIIYNKKLRSCDMLVAIVATNGKVSSSGTAWLGAAHGQAGSGKLHAGGPDVTPGGKSDHRELLAARSGTQARQGHLQMKAVARLMNILFTIF